MKLPVDFTNRMKDMLGDEFDEFVAGYDKERMKGLRLNPIKDASLEALSLKKNPFSLSPIKWAKNGYFYSDEDQPGKHPWHEAGVYYIQEPSAMCVADFLQAKPGERILDLCAAPGGKSTQAASALMNQGFMVSNEIMPLRAKILSQNIERMGIRNCVVTNEDSGHLAEYFPEFFDGIIVDAPCSGEGMFRKDEGAITEWSLDNVKLCAARQDEILDNAHKMLKPGGRLVYSTCTFAPAENEQAIGRFIERHPEYVIFDVPEYEEFSHGVPEWGYVPGGETPDSSISQAIDSSILQAPDSTLGEAADSTSELATGRTAHTTAGIEKTVRVWPHKASGEGHYAALLRKGGELSFASSEPLVVERDSFEYVESYENTSKSKKKSKADKAGKGKGYSKGNSSKGSKGNSGSVFLTDREKLKIYEEFINQTMANPSEWLGHDNMVLFGDELSLLPTEMPDFKGLRIVRPGLHLGTFKKNRFEPSHALALAVKASEVKESLDVTWDSSEVKAYLRGESLNVPDFDGKGWTLITVDGFSLGWGKAAGGVVKNHYPKGLRK